MIVMNYSHVLRGVVFSLFTPTYTTHTNMIFHNHAQFSTLSFIIMFYLNQNLYGLSS